MSLQKPQLGFSLIELMITIILSSLLLLGVLQLYINTSATDRTSNELARVQESGRVALELIAREARRAGYQGCVAASNSSTATIHTGRPSPDDKVTVVFPTESLAGTVDSLTFRYGRPASEVPALPDDFPNRDCDNSTLAGYQITFSNCGDNLCVSAPDIGNNQQLVANTNFAEITYLEACGTNTCTLDLSAPPIDMANVRKLQITLAVNDSRGEFVQPRTFTSVIELRNRL